VKGLAEPVEAYEVAGAGPLRTRMQALAARGLTRFVGRQVELEQLREALEQAGRGQGQVVAVVGEPGVGKSRLFHEFVHSHRTHGWRVLEASSISHGKATAYRPVVDLLRSYFRMDARDDLRAIRAKVTGTLVTLDPALTDAVPAILGLLDALPPESPFLRLEGPERRQRTLHAVKRVMLCECRVQPLLVVFEDLHWIDSETQAVLDGLVESLPTAALLLAVNYRPEYGHGWGGKTYYRQLRLDPLPPESAAELLHHLVGTDPALEALKALLIERTEGNPFFLEESVRTLVETRMLDGERGAYELTRPVASIQVPASVQAVLAARIDRLDPEDKELLQAAAVVGKDVPLPLLQGASDLTGEHVARGLARLQAAEFLYETSLFPDPEYTFKHALTHEVAYGSLIAERRCALHARVLETIEQRAGDQPSEHIVQLAHHALRAERWDQALRYQREAGQRAASRSAHREAVTCFDQALTALAHLPDDPQTREQAIDLRLELRGSLAVAGDLSRIPPVLQEAEMLATEIGDRRRLAVVLLFFGWYHMEMAESARAGELFERVLDMARDLGDPQIEALALFHLGFNLYVLGQFHRAIEVLAKAADACQEQPVQQFAGQTPGALDAGSLIVLARTLIEVGRFDEALARAERALEMSEAANDAFNLVHVRFAMGYAHLRRGDFARAIAVLEQGLEIARARSVAFLEPATSGALGSAYAYSGRTAEGLPLLEGGVRGADSMGHVGFRMWIRTWLAEGYLLAGRPAEASAMARTALEAARRVGRRGRTSESLRLLGDIAALAEPPATEEAERHYTEGLAMARERGMRPLEARLHFSLGRLYRRTGQRDQAREQLAAAITMLREMDMTYWLEQAEMQGLA
jgi:tetratricopeptide (TPR) repeat protein